MTLNRRRIPPRPASAITRCLSLAMLVGACVAVMPAWAGAAANASHDKERFTVSPDTMCGFTGTSDWLYNVTTVPTGNGSTVSAGRLVQTFVADNGRGVKISYDAGSFIEGPTTFYPDGSSSFTAVANGLNAKTQALGGRLLEQSTGRVHITVYFDANGDYLTTTIDSTTGPQNNITGQPDCTVIGPYLAGS